MTSIADSDMGGPGRCTAVFRARRAVEYTGATRRGKSRARGALVRHSRQQGLRCGDEHEARPAESRRRAGRTVVADLLVVGDNRAGADHRAAYSRAATDSTAVEEDRVEHFG